MQLLVVGAESGAQDNRLERRESKFKFGNVRYLTYKVEEPRDADEDLENDPLAHQVLTTNINTTSLGECAMVGIFPRWTLLASQPSLASQLQPKAGRGGGCVLLGKLNVQKTTHVWSTIGFVERVSSAVHALRPCCVGQKITNTPPPSR